MARTALLVTIFLFSSFVAVADPEEGNKEKQPKHENGIISLPVSRLYFSCGGKDGSFQFGIAVPGKEGCVYSIVVDHKILKLRLRDDGEETNTLEIPDEALYGWRNGKEQKISYSELWENNYTFPKLATLLCPTEENLATWQLFLERISEKQALREEEHLQEEVPKNENRRAHRVLPPDFVCACDELEVERPEKPVLKTIAFGPSQINYEGTNWRIKLTVYNPENDRIEEWELNPIMTKTSPFKIVYREGGLPYVTIPTDILSDWSASSSVGIGLPPVFYRNSFETAITIWVPKPEDVGVWENWLKEQQKRCEERVQRELEPKTIDPFEYLNSSLYNPYR